jgi:hypothetical protein
LKRGARMLRVNLQNVTYGAMFKRKISCAHVGLRLGTQVSQRGGRKSPARVRLAIHLGRKRGKRGIVHKLRLCVQIGLVRAVGIFIEPKKLLEPGLSAGAKITWY